MPDNTDNDELMWQLVNEFTKRVEQGETPSIEEYCQRYPNLADEIRDLLPTIVEVESMSASSSRDRKTVPAPESVGEYRIIRTIGRGGMGVVYEAEHKTLQRRVALKVLSQRLAHHEVAVERFHREARAIAKLHHTNIVPLFGVGEEDGFVFLAMQLISGDSLDRVIKKLAKSEGSSGVREVLGRHPQKLGDDGGETEIDEPVAESSGSLSGIGPSRVIRRIAQIGVEAANALHYAHERGIVHRDIKPSNLILDDEGNTWLTDFGLAKTDEDAVTQTGDLVGTLRYMAPEQFQGISDERSDIYALGLTLYELLTLQTPFTTTDRLELMNIIANEEPRQPRSLRPGIPRDLETIVLKAAHKVPASRYQTGADLSADLQRFLHGEPIQARRASFFEVTKLWARRNKALAASLAALAVLLIAGFIGTSVAAVRFREQAERTKQDLYRAEMLLAGRELEKPGGIASVRHLLSNWIPDQGEVDRRGPEWHFYNRMGHDELQSFEHPAPVQTAQFSPNDQLVATGAEDGFLRLWNAESGELLHQIKAHAGTIDDVAFSKDGMVLVTVSSDKSAKVWNAKSGELIQELEGHTSRVTSAAFRDDGQCFATGAEDGLRFWDGQTLELIHECKTNSPASTHIAEMSWHPQKNLLLTISHDDTILVWDAESGQLDSSYAWLNEMPELEFWFGNSQIAWSPNADRILAIGHWNAIIDLPTDDSPSKGQAFQHHANALCGGWSNDGKYFMLAGDTLELFLFDAVTREEVGRIRGHESTITDCATNSDGTKIVTASKDRTVKIWEFPMNPGSEGPGAEGGLALSPDATRVAVSGGMRNKVLITELETEELIGQFTSPIDTWVGYISYDPAGEKIAVASGNGETDSMVYILDGRLGELLRTINPNSVYVQFLAWHPTEAGLLAVGQSTDQPMEFWNANDGELVESQEYMSWKWNAADWSPDGRWLAYAGWRPEVVDWGSRQIEVKLDEINEAPYAVQFSRDGKLLAVGSEESAIRLYETGTWKLLATLTGHAGPVLELQWGPRSERLASIGADWTLRLWDPTAERVVLSHDLGSKPQSLQWSKNGEVIVVSVDKKMHVFRMGVAR